MHIDDETCESSSAEHPLSALARAADEAAAGDAPMEAWTPGQGLSYQVKERRRSLKDERLQKIGTAAVIIAATSLLIEVVMFAVAALDLPDQLLGLLGFGAFITMVAALSMASLASRDGGDRKLIMASRVLALAWMPICFAFALAQGANLGGIACFAIALVGIAGVLMILAVIIREMLLAYV